MAHNKVYGVCENKCKVEVSPKSERFKLIETINLSMNFRVSFYRFKNVVLAHISGTLPKSPLTVEYPESIPYPLYPTSARNVVNSGYAKILSTDDKNLTLQGNPNASFECDLFFLVSDDPTSAVCSVSRTTLNVGDKIIIKADINNDNWDHEWQYKFIVKNMTTGHDTVIKQYSTDNTYLVNISTAGAKEFYVIAKDESGNEYESNHVAVEAKEALSAQLMVNGSIDAQELIMGAAVDLTVNATGGSAPYSYQFIVNNAEGTSEYVLKDWNDAATYPTKIANANTKVFYARVMDNAGNAVTTNSVKVTVKS